MNEHSSNNLLQCYVNEEGMSFSVFPSCLPSLPLLQCISWVRCLFLGKDLVFPNVFFHRVFQSPFDPERIKDSILLYVWVNKIAFLVDAAVDQHSWCFLVVEVWCHPCLRTVFPQSLSDLRQCLSMVLLYTVFDSGVLDAFLSQ